VIAQNKRDDRGVYPSEPEIEYLAYQELAKLDEGLTVRET